MKDAVYARNVAARAFDVVRYVLPLAVPTNVGQVVTSARSRSRSVICSPHYAEVRQVGELLKAACERRRSICGASSAALEEQASVNADAHPPRARQPVLARCLRCARGHLGPGSAARRAGAFELVELAPSIHLRSRSRPHCSIAWRLPYRQIVEAVSGWSEARRRTVIDAALAGRSRRSYCRAAVRLRARLRRAHGRRRLA
jgi:hypothetical protein